MEERITLTVMGKKFIEEKISKEEFSDFFENFKTGLKSIQDEFKNTVEPSIYFNADSKKISEKSAVFSSLHEEMGRGVRVIESSLEEPVNIEKFKKGYQTILLTADKLENFKKDISALANSTQM